MITLGSNMELSGFNDFDNSTKVIIKKLVGNQVKVINDSLGDFERLSLNLNRSEDQGYLLSGKMEMGGQVYTSEASELNLFFALSKVLDKLKEAAS